MLRVLHTEETYGIRTAILAGTREEVTRAEGLVRRSSGGVGARLPSLSFDPNRLLVEVAKGDAGLKYLDKLVREARL